MALKLESPAFAPRDPIPPRYTCDGDDVSPPLAWTGMPATARSLVVLCDDPDAPGGNWSHWALYDLAASCNQLPEGLPTNKQVEQARQGITDFGRSGYAGPCPPRGHGVHRYHFRLLALDVPTLGLPAGADFESVARAAQAHCIEQAELVGTYARA